MLAPRGYGRTSFRLYEAFQFNCVPVYISDVPYLPYVDVIDWSDYAILIGPDQIGNIQSILQDCISSGRYETMLSNIKEGRHFFTMDYMVDYIEMIVDSGR